MSEILIDAFIGIIVALITSSGLWAYFSRKLDKKTKGEKLLLAIAHDRIVYLGMQYVHRGWISRDEYENLHDFLYATYQELGGNGTAKRVVDEVNKLPIKEIDITKIRTGELKDDRIKTVNPR